MVKKEKFFSENQIVVNSAPHFAVSAIIAQAAGTADATTGKKIVKAGTPLYGDLQDRTKTFTKATSGGSVLVGVLQHDADVTVSDANGDVLVIGVVNLDRMSEETQALITAEVVTALPTIKFIRSN